MAKTRLLLDTCAVIDLITSSDETDVEFWNIFDDPDTMPYASFETARELVVHFNNKTLLSKHWQTARQMLTYIHTSDAARTTAGGRGVGGGRITPLQPVNGLVLTKTARGRRRPEGAFLSRRGAGTRFSACLYFIRD